jgi:hypothetical protein
MKLIRLLLILVVVVVGGGFLGSLALNGALRKGVETAGSEALSVPTTLEGVALGLLSGKLDLTNLAIANPPAYGDDPFLSLESGHAELAIMSLREDVIELPVLELSGLTLQLVQRLDGSNYRTLLENVGGVDEPAGEAPPAPPSQPTEAKSETFWIIREVVFRDVRVTGVVEGELGGQTLRREGTLNLPEVRLTDVGEGGDALPLEDQIGRMLEGLLGAVFEDSSGVLPEGLGNDLGAVLATGFKQDDLEGLARDRLDQEVQKGLDKLFEK